MSLLFFFEKMSLLISVSYFMRRVRFFSNYINYNIHPCIYDYWLDIIDIIDIIDLVERELMITTSIDP